MSTFGKTIILLGGNCDDTAHEPEDSVFILNTSQITFPPEFISTSRNDSFRSIQSEPPLQHIPFSSSTKFPTWSARSPTPDASAAPNHSLTHEFSIHPRSPTSSLLRTPSDQQISGFFTEQESEHTRNELLSPLPIVAPLKLSIPSSQSRNPFLTSPARSRGVPQLSIDDAFPSWSPESFRSTDASPSTPIGPQSMNDNQAAISDWLNYSVHRGSHSSLNYIPPEGEYDSTLWQFLNNCDALSNRFKIKSLKEPVPDQDSHFSTGTDEFIGYQRSIDSGSNSDVFQVIMTKQLSYNRCLTSNHRRYQTQQHVNFRIATNVMG